MSATSSESSQRKRTRDDVLLEAVFGDPGIASAVLGHLTQPDLAALCPASKLTREAVRTFAAAHDVPPAQVLTDADSATRQLHIAHVAPVGTVKTLVGIVRWLKAFPRAKAVLVDVAAAFTTAELAPLTAAGVSVAAACDRVGCPAGGPASCWEVIWRDGMAHTVLQAVMEAVTTEGEGEDDPAAQMAAVIRSVSSGAALVESAAFCAGPGVTVAVIRDALRRRGPDRAWAASAAWAAPPHAAASGGASGGAGSGDGEHAAR